MVDDATREKLVRWGHLQPGEDIDAGIRNYQDFFQEDLDERCQVVHGRGLSIDGDAGPVTMELLDTPRCGCPDRLTAGSALEANWPDSCRNNLGVYVSYAGLGSFRSAADEESEIAWKQWNDVIDVRLHRVDSASVARIVGTTAALSGSTLAWSYLANNSCQSVLQQRYNSRTNWSRILFRAVRCHEDGHALGYGHSSDRRDLMYPYARPDINKPSEGDIANMVRLGYRRRETPTPDPDPDEPLDQTVTKLVKALKDMTKQQLTLLDNRFPD